MIIINRKMQIEEMKQTEHPFGCCQASINSDGRITLRNYNGFDKNNDEIMILTEKETKAIFKLMRVMKGFEINDGLPF